MNTNIGLQLHLQTKHKVMRPNPGAKPDDWTELPPLLAVTLESALEGIVTVDCCGKVICYNSRFIALWGIPTDLVEQGTYADWMTFAATLTCHPEQFIERERETAWSEEGLDFFALKDGRVIKRQIQPHLIGSEYVIRVITFRVVTQHHGIESMRSMNETNPPRPDNSAATGESMTEVARAISAPAQYVCDNLSFLQNAFHALQNVLEVYPELIRAAKIGPVNPELIARAEAALSQDDLKYFQEQVPASLRDTTNGIAKILNGVRAFDESSQRNKWNTDRPA